MFGFGRGKKREFFELLHCSNPRTFGRLWERRIVVTGNMAQLVEAWPVAGRDGADCAAALEWTVAFSGPVKAAAGYDGCPHCGGWAWFRCDCHAVLCTGGEDPSDRCTCPCCLRRWNLDAPASRISLFEGKFAQVRLPGPVQERLPPPLPRIAHVRRKLLPSGRG